MKLFNQQFIIDRLPSIPILNCICSSSTESFVNRPLYTTNRYQSKSSYRRSAYKRPTVAASANSLNNNHPAAHQRREMKLVLVVAVALIKPDGSQILLAQRPPGKAMAGLWEFPGGKVEQSETPEEALLRELEEELGIIADPASLIPLCFASHTYEEQHFHLLMPLYVCKKWQGNPVGRENQKLTWCGVDDLTKYEMPAADLPLLPPIQAVMRNAASRNALNRSIAQNEKN